MPATAKQLANLKPAKKGEVRNPRGKNGYNTPEAIRELARRSSPTAIRKLVKLISSKDDRIALHAAAKIVEIGLGGDGVDAEKSKGLTINIMSPPEPPKPERAVTIEHTPTVNGHHTSQQLDAPTVSIRPVGLSS